MKKILLPTDFSPAAHNAYQYAIALAEKIGAKIELMHVYTISFTGWDIFIDMAQQRMLRVEKQKQMEEKMDDFINQYEFKNIGDRLVYPGLFVDQEIIDRSKRGCDLIIMGTKGERNAMNKFMGSVTTHLMMNAGCPVLAVPENAKFQGVQKIAYATSFGFKDHHFVKKLVDFGAYFDSKIHFVHVSDDIKINIEDDLKLDNLSSMFVRFSVINNPSIMEGLDNFIKEHAVDTLALYIPKRSLWERLFHSSFTKKMTFHTDTPLFVFHE